MPQETSHETRVSGWRWRLLAAVALAATGLVAGATASSATPPTTYCNNEDTEYILEGGSEDLPLSSGNTNLVGLDVGDLLDDPGSLTVCLFNGSSEVYFDTTGGVTVKVLQCPTYTSCSPTLATTGLMDTDRPLTISIVPTDIDTGYDLWIGGTNVTPVGL